MLYVITGLQIVIWVIVFIGFNSTGLVHILLGIALLIILVRISLKANYQKSSKTSAFMPFK